MTENANSPFAQGNVCQGFLFLDGPERKEQTDWGSTKRDGITIYFVKNSQKNLALSPEAVAWLKAQPVGDAKDHDIGWEREEDGSYTFYWSDSPGALRTCHCKPNASFQVYDDAYVSAPNRTHWEMEHYAKETRKAMGLE